MDYGQKENGIDYIDGLDLDYKWDAPPRPNESKILRQKFMPDYAKGNAGRTRTNGRVRGGL